MSWDLDFAEPIVLAHRRKLATLREAIAHLGKVIPKSEYDMKEVQAAARCLTQAAEHGGPVSFARIGVMQAINRHVERIFDLSRKDNLGDGGARQTAARPAYGWDWASH
jgi:hypothetical protein